jgi:carrier protein
MMFQIGYEPVPPRTTKTLFGRPALALPNVFQYSKYNVDDF